MTEKLRKGFKNYSTSVSATLREKLEQIKGDKDPTDKRVADPSPVKIRLRSDSEKLLHSYPIRCENFPITVKGEFKWYRMNNNSKDEDPTDNFQLLASTNGPTFHPNIEDSTSEIACQWVPDNNLMVLYQPSNFARVGPLIKDPTILTDAQLMIDSNSASFRVDMSDINTDQNSKLLNVDCKTATIMIMENILPKEKEKEKDVDGDIDDTSSHHSPSLSSRASATFNFNNNSGSAIPLTSPQQPPKLKWDDINTTTIGSPAETTPSIIETEDNNNSRTEATAEPITSIQDNKCEPSLDNSNPDAHPAEKTIANNKNAPSKIKIRHDFQLQMSRKNTQELSIIKKSNKGNVQILDIFLQTTRDRDILYTVLNALINKKRDKTRSQTSERCCPIRNISDFFW